MDIKRARELIGKRDETMSDEDILKLQGQMEIIAEIVIDQVIKKSKNKTKQSTPRQG